MPWTDGRKIPGDKLSDPWGMIPAKGGEMDAWTRALIIETKVSCAATAAQQWSCWPSARKRSFEQRYAAAVAQGARPMLASDAQFPRPWHALSSPPKGAWLLGDWQHHETRFGVVGARAAPPRVRRQVEAYAAACSEQGERLVSGAAVGVDQAAHRGAALQGSVAVVPFGIDQRVVGQGQLPLGLFLAGGGCIWSPALLRHGARARFVARNRLLAALCLRLVVAWAAPRSGSMHTVRFAKQLGIPIEAWWQSSDPPGNNGCRALCGGGAPAPELLLLMNQLAGVQGCVARLPHDPSGLRALQLLELECASLIRRLDTGRYELLWSAPE
jgi:predicted Rossmann fold nucleotide-binding protein DprA/Smf involved in DNA uptake